MVPMSALVRLLEINVLTLYRVDHLLNCVKGGGACHLREKVLAEAATTFVTEFLFHDIKHSIFFLQLHPRC